MAHDVSIAIRRARSLIQKYSDGRPPVPIEQIANAFGVVIQYLALDDELSGMAFTRDGQKRIIVNSGHHPNRQRFTLAHELAHHVLHAACLDNQVHVDAIVMRRDKASRFGTEPLEVEANAFAAELLMPLAMVKKFKHVDINDDEELEAIARTFRVSIAAISYRLINIAN